MTSGAEQLEFLVSPKIGLLAKMAVFIEKPRNVFDAQEFCELNQAQFYQPKSVVDYEILKQFANQHRIYSFWIGISNHSSQGIMTIYLQKLFY